jgi:hypothetical protein
LKHQTEHHGMKAPAVMGRQAILGRTGSDGERQKNSPLPCLSFRPAKSACPKTDRAPASPRRGNEQGPGCVPVSFTRPRRVTSNGDTLLSCVSLALREKPLAEKRLLAVLALCGVLSIGHCAVSLQSLLANWAGLTHWVLNAIS